MITDLKLTKNKKRVNIYINGEFAFNLDKEVAINAGLHKGNELNDRQANKLKDLDSFQRCMDAALVFLSYRPRSEMEVKQRLRRRGFAYDTINRIITKLQKQGLIDDTEFIKYWINNRSAFNPKGKSLLKVELRRKGVNNNIINELLNDINDEENAYRAATKKMRTITMENLEYEEFRAKLFNHLKWRGFGYGVMESVCGRIWEERKAEIY